VCFERKQFDEEVNTLGGSGGQSQADPITAIASSLFTIVQNAFKNSLAGKQCTPNLCSAFSNEIDSDIID
jgi:hypothetical protein